MKLFTLILFMLCGIAQITSAQEGIKTPKLNVMSNVFGISAEGGATLGITDYDSKKINYMGKASFEYYLPSTGKGNIGIRLFGQTGFISGKAAPLGAINPTDEFVTKLDMYGAAGLYNISLGDAVNLIVGVGVSNLMFYPKDADNNKLPNYVGAVYNTYMLAFNGDAAIRVMLSKQMSVNLTGGLIMGSKDFLDDIKTGPNNDMLVTAMAGVSYYFGRERDSDDDGVPNSEDACPGTAFGVKVDEFGCPIDSDKDGIADYLDKCADTPIGVKVDGSGCPLDSDSDGVPDYLDKCSNTPMGVKVDLTGCPVDSDSDGVPDYLDKCSNTPISVKVDASGCPIDSDGDGIADYLDKCPDTPKGTKVNADGCPVDSDGDGVPDYLDKCPNTPMGVQVDAAGCPIKKEKETVVIVLPGEVKSLVLSGDTNFEFNKAKLLSNAFPELDSLVSTMNKQPDYKWEVGGYTDGIGSVSANKKLSLKRAQAVVDYLVGKGVKKGTLKIVGYGKENPIATNETVEGRSMNRRVEIKVLPK